MPEVPLITGSGANRRRRSRQRHRRMRTTHPPAYHKTNKPVITFTYIPVPLAYYSLVQREISIPAGFVLFPNKRTPPSFPITSPGLINLSAPNLPSIYAADVYLWRWASKLIHALSNGWRLVRPK